MAVRIKVKKYFDVSVQTKKGMSAATFVLAGQGASQAALLSSTDQGELRSSNKREHVGELDAIFFNDAPHSSFVEWGTSPHTPPFEPIKEWARRKGIEEKAGAIWQSIRKKGTKPHPFIRPAADWVRTIAGQVAARVLRSFYRRG